MVHHGRLSQKHFLIIASQIIDVLMHLHSKQYVHSDIKAENIMIGLCNESLTTDCDRNDGLKKNQCGGSKPLRRGRKLEMSHSNSHHVFYNGAIRSHYLRPSKSISYIVDEENSRSTYSPESGHADSDYSDDHDEDFELSPRRKKGSRFAGKTKGKFNSSRLPVKNLPKKSMFNMPKDKLKATEAEKSSDDRVFVIDYGLATKFMDTNG
jgi:serine/threonine protein kinase